MSKSFKKFVAIALTIAMVVVGITYIPSANVSAIDWSDMSAWTSVTVNGTEYKLASENNWAKGFQKFDAGAYMTVASLWANFPDAAYTKAVINGTEYASSDHQDSSDTVRFMGAQVWWNPALCSKTQNTVLIYNGDTLRDTIYVYNPNGVDTEPETETDENGNVVTTAAPETTTTALQKPSAPTGLVANINDLKTNYTIAFANVTGATSYKFYVDGTYKKDIGNGGIVTIEELGLEAGKTYTFGVSAVNAAGESDISTISVTVPAAEEVTTPSESEGQEETTPAEEFDPSTITEWTKVTNSSTISYYIADGADSKVSVKPQVEGTDIYTAYGLAAKFKSVVLNGKSLEPDGGALTRIPIAEFDQEYNKLVVTNYYGNESVTIYFKVSEAAPYVDGEVLVNESNVTKEVGAITGGDYWQVDYNNLPITYVTGKKYVAEVVVSSTATKTIKLVFQRVNIWDFVDAAAGYEATITAGNKVKITYVFDATQSTDNGNFDIYLGSIADATTLVFESKKLTTYNEVPEGVATGVEVLSTPEETTTETPSEIVTDPVITVDDEEVTVTDGKVTLGDAAYGYYCDGKMYAPNTAVAVTEDMAFKSVNELSVTMANGAGIRYIGSAGIRFQSTITSDNMTAVDSAAITEGTLITAVDIYESKGQPLTLTSGYTKINVVNSGWYNSQVGTYCGSICNVIESNYIRHFTARAYVTINYENADAVTIYSNMGPDRTISGIATAVKAAGYPNIPDDYKATIDSFIK